jgi:AcrR family transcriptional regulator
MEHFMAGRPREFSRDDALAKARDVFWAHGYEGTSMSDLVLALGLASSRIYAAFGSKEELFREAVALYRDGEGGNAIRALEAAPTARSGIERMLRTAVETYTQTNRPRGCMVVTAATNCSPENQAMMKWLSELRCARNRAILERLRRAVETGELASATNVQAFADYFGSVMSGLSVQARDGVSKSRLIATIPSALMPLETRIRKPRPN